MFFICLLQGFYSYGQQNIKLLGKVNDENGKPLAYVSIKIIEYDQILNTNHEGLFNMSLNNPKLKELNLEFSHIGYQKQTKTISLNRNQIDISVVLKELNLSLRTIEVNAKRGYKGNSNTSLIIGRDLIEQIPSLSLYDILNQIPNKKIAAPSLQNVQNITLRGAFSEVSSGRNIHEMSNSFGVAIIVDGNNISNNQNMQSYNPGLDGSSASATMIGVSSYGLNGTANRTYTGDFPYSGIDLRQIPTSQIESIEVISGVPSAKYGDLTDGAVIVERQAGESPTYFRLQLRDNATSYGLTSGIKLNDKLGNINIGVNYVNSFQDNRDKLKSYNRLNINIMHTNYYGKNNKLKNTTSIDYARNLDGIKKDADDPTGKIAKFDSWNFSMGNRTAYRLNGSFFKNVSLNLRYAEGHQKSYTEYYSNYPYILTSDATTTGIHEGYFAQGIYIAQSLIDGRPLNISANIDFNNELHTGNLVHSITFGGGYNYGANKGLGQVLDPSRPRALSAVKTTSTGTNRSDRYYDFSLAVPQNSFNAYLEDVLKLKVLKKDLNIRAGLRYDIQNGFSSYAPRFNTNYKLNDAVTLGLAYGLSFKSPALGQIYPGPTYFEIPIANAYNGNVEESIYLLYVKRYDPSAKNIKSARGRTLEFSSKINLKPFDVSIAVYQKQFDRGISSSRTFSFIELPTYTATFRPNQKPLLTLTGSKKYESSVYEFRNTLKSQTQGFDIIISTPTYQAISTGFTFSGGFLKSRNYNSDYSYTKLEITNTAPEQPLIAIYPNKNTVSYFSSSRITSNTHIPKAGLFVQITAEFQLMQKSIHPGYAGIPIAYYDNDYNYHIIQNFDKNNPVYGHLYKPESELNSDNVNKIIPNFHLNVGKEIKKRFKIAFNVYNFLNYQPYYINSSNTYIYPNTTPTFGAEISMKL